MQDKLDIIDENKEKWMIQKGIVKEMIERIERQDNGTLKLANSKETIRKKWDIKKERDMMRKEKENDSSKKNDSLREKID